MTGSHWPKMLGKNNTQRPEQTQGLRQGCSSQKYIRVAVKDERKIEQELSSETWTEDS